MITNILSGLVLVLFSIILIRKNLFLRKQHKKVHFLMFGNKPRLTRLIEAFVLITNYPMMIMWALLTVELVKFDTFAHRQYWFIDGVGLMYMYVGVLIYGLALRELGVYWKLGVEYNGDDNFVRTGIYTISRHPAYVGFYMMFVGIMIIFPIMIPLGVLSMVALFLLAKQEDRYLIYRFKEDYLDYKKKVKMFFGFKKQRKRTA